jgi:hypothetical protein
VNARIAWCGLLFGCLPAVELELPEPPFEAKTWVLIDPPSGRVFEPGDLRFIAQTNEEIAIAAYAPTAEELQLPIDESFPLVIGEGRNVVIDPDFAAVFEADEVDDGRRTFSRVDELGVFLPDLEREFCFQSERCRPAASSEFAWCESICGPSSLDRIVAPMGVPEEPPPPECRSGEQPFVSGCRHLGPACPSAGEWPQADHRADSSLALADALSTALPFATIAVRGSLSGEFTATRPVRILGTCVEDASIEKLVVRSDGVELVGVRVESLVVEFSECTVIGSDVAVTSMSSNLRIMSSLLRTSLIESTTATISDSVIASPLTVALGMMHLDDTYVARNATFRNTEVAVKRCVVSGAAWLSSIDATLVAEDSVLGVVTSSSSTTIITRSLLRAKDASGPFSARLGSATLTNSIIRSNGRGMTLEETLGSLTSVEIHAVDTGLIIRKATRNGVQVAANDLKVVARDGIDVVNGLRLARAEIVARNIGIYVRDDAMLDLGHARVAADLIGIDASSSSNVAAEDFVLTGHGTGVVFGRDYEGGSSFARGSIETDVGVMHEETGDFDVDRHFFQTLFSNDKRIVGP